MGYNYGKTIAIGDMNCCEANVNLSALIGERMANSVQWRNHEYHGQFITCLKKCILFLQSYIVQHLFLPCVFEN